MSRSEKTSEYAVERVLPDVRRGRMVILVDDEDRENEGDLFVAAERATPEAINFMATHGRGLISLALTEERTRALGLARRWAWVRARRLTIARAPSPWRSPTGRGPPISSV